MKDKQKVKSFYQVLQDHEEIISFYKHAMVRIDYRLLCLISLQILRQQLM